MKELDKIVAKYGYEFRQEKQTVSGYVYSKWDGDRLEGYEVFKRLENKQYNCVSFPTDKAFGVWAWAYKTFERANDKLLQL